MYKISIILLFSLINSAFCLDLDELNFSKVVSKFKTVLTKFDVSFPYGPVHEAYAKFAQEINNKTISGTNHPDVLIATVGVKDYGDYENKKIADKYGITADSFPVMKLFIDGDLENPIHFEKGKEDPTSDDFFLFLKQHSKAYIQSPGCTRQLDELTDKFMSQKGQRPEILRQVEEAVKKIECEKKKNLSKFYVVLMNGIIEKGDDFIEKQHERMKKLLKDKLSPKKLEELTKKIHILSSFKYNKTFKDEL